MPGFDPQSRFPRSNAYDAGWVRALDMGPNPLWQLEDLLRVVDVEPGQRVLDLGAGLGATSVFLARECGAVVDSYDYWVDAARVQTVIDEAGVGELVTVHHGDIRAERLPAEIYDVILSVDAWEYFGTDTRFLDGLVPALKPGGRLGFTTPMLRDDPYQVAPDPALADLIGWEIAGWHAPSWWLTHTQLTGQLSQVESRQMADSLDHWIVWEAGYPETTTDAPSPLLTVLHALRATDPGGDEPPVALGMVTATKGRR